MKFTAAQIAALKAMGPEGLAILAEAGYQEQEPTPTDVTGLTAKVTDLTGQLEAATAKFEEATVTITGLNAEVERLTAEVKDHKETSEKAVATSTTLRAAVLARCNVMAVALNATKPAETISDSDLAAMHEDLSGKMTAAFKTGGITQNTQKAEQQDTGKPLFTQAQMAAARKIVVHR